MGAHAKPPANSKKEKHKLRITVICAVVLLLAALSIGAYLLFSYSQAEQKYLQLQEVAGLEASDVVALETQMDEVAINWAALRAINADIVAWIMIPGTSISYPIVQTTDNSYYLNHLFDNSSGANGAIFLDYESKSDLSSKNNMIYGHNMMDGSMFAQIKQYQDSEFYNAHKRIMLFTPQDSFELEVVASLICNGDDTIRRLGFSDQTDYQNYVSELLSYALISDIDAGNVPERIFTLATCTNFNNSKRFMVLARQVEPARE